MAKFALAWESADLDALVDLLTDDVFFSMPPIPFEHVGRDLAARLCASIFRADRRFDLVPTRANGQPAFGVCLRAPNGISNGTSLYVLTLAGDRVSAMTLFGNSMRPWFRLPRSLPSPIDHPRRHLRAGTASSTRSSAADRSRLLDIKPLSLVGGDAVPRSSRWRTSGPWRVPSVRSVSPPAGQ